MKFITRVPYGFYAYGSEDEKQLNDFLGIDPSGMSIDLYLASKTQSQLESWRDYWLTIWTNLQRGDLYAFTLKKYTERSTKKPEEESSSVKEGYYIHKDHCDYTTKAGKIEYTSKSKCEKALKKMQEEAEKEKEEEVDPAWKQNWDKMINSAQNGDWSGVKAFIFGDPDSNLIAGTMPIGPAGFTSMAGLSTRLTGIAKFLNANWAKVLALGTTSFGLAFGNEWFAKEGLIESVTIPLATEMKNFEYKPTKESLQIIQDYYAKYGKNLAKAKTMIGTWSWLWPFTRAQWMSSVSTYELDYAEKGTKIDAYVKSMEKPVIPERVKTFVRDITDGDTLVISPKGKDADTGADVQLPIGSDKVHSVVRIAGINAPEKSPKGEIVCTGIDIYQVEKSFADASRANLLPLNDKEITLFIDPADSQDVYGRVIARVDLNGEDIGLSQIKKGLACYYGIGTNKYIDSALYISECNK
ncbi:MAG: thermonuclease family protein, partial [Candidatus Paceibacterota bacterium]